MSKIDIAIGVSVLCVLVVVIWVIGIITKEGERLENKIPVGSVNGKDLGNDWYYFEYGGKKFLKYGRELREL